MTTYLDAVPSRGSRTVLDAIRKGRLSTGATGRTAGGAQAGLPAALLLAAAFLAVAFSVLGAGRASAETRYALVIGNGRYDAVPSLQNAVADARAMRRQLEATGFSVTYREDADRRAMNRAVDEFVGKLSTDSVAVLYYAGHGVQIGAANYLVPTDVRAETAGDLVSDAVELSRVLDRMTGAQARFALAIVDACRDNPFTTPGRTVGAPRGLAPTTSANGMMVVFSAGASQTALDRLGERDTNPNGVFTREWLQAMALPGISVQAAAVQVRQSVAALARSVGHVQVPAVYDQSLGTFEFLPGPATAAVQAPAPVPSPAAPATAPAPRPEQASSAAAPPRSPAPPAPVAASVPVQDCDRLAQPSREVLGRMALTDGVARAGVDKTAAQAACARAMAEWPDEPRFATYAGRVADLFGNVPEAMRLWRAAAAQGNALAQYNLAYQFEDGTGGTTRDLREAVRLYRLAADQAMPEACVSLGYMHLKGTGGLPRNDREAVRLFRVAAEQGNPRGMLNLGTMYAEGRGGLARDAREAIRLWRLAAAQGEQAALGNLRRIGAAPR